jgi:hypothetical protein
MKNPNTANYSRLASYFLRAGRASCKNMSSPVVSGASLAWSLAIVSPAFEKTRSDGAEVAEMHSSQLAKCGRRGNFNTFTFHYVNRQLK